MAWESTKEVLGDLREALASLLFSRMKDCSSLPCSGVNL
jgi:hypothetical protein